MTDDIESLVQEAMKISGRYIAIGTAQVMIRRAFEMGWHAALGNAMEDGS